MNTLRVACLQSKAFVDPEESLYHHEERIRAAAFEGANLICTQELFSTPYFCQTQDPRNFDKAECIPGPVTDRFSGLANELNVVLVLSLFERKMAGVYYNSTVVVDTEGSIKAVYRKTHIPQDPGFEEKFYFTPGDTGFRSVATSVGTIGVLICWDQWFPEAARLTALDGAEILLCPTAIGWLAEDSPEERATQLRMWQQVQQGHAIANSCYWVAVNRVGIEGNLHFWGSSFVCDFTGKELARASEDKAETLYVDCDLTAQEAHRRTWPFFRDRRPEMYK